MNRIEIRLRELGQLFNSMDPTPFHHQDLDPEAEEFIVGWAEEHPTNLEVELVIHLEHPPSELHAEDRVAEAIHNYFSYRAEFITRDLRQLLRRGRICLVIGLAFLTVCIVAADLIGRAYQSPISGILQESLTIGGWVAMWRPLEIFLYDWWPITKRREVLQKLGRASVKLETPSSPCT